MVEYRGVRWLPADEILYLSLSSSESWPKQTAPIKNPAKLHTSQYSQTRPPKQIICRCCALAKNHNVIPKPPPPPEGV